VGARRGSGRCLGASSEVADGTQLGIERSFEYRKDRILEVIGHEKPPAQRRRRRIKESRSVCQQLFYKTDLNVETPDAGFQPA
jgi:hypothetical protein